MTAKEELIMYLLDDTCVDTCSKCIHDGWYKNHADKGCPHENKYGHKACLEGMTKYFEQERLKRGTLGERIKEKRMSKCMAQRELSRRSGIEQGSISLYEKDLQQPTAFSLMCIADVLECSTDYLLGRE